MTATAASVGITRPGVYQLAADTYHADPVHGGSLSSSGARQILPPGCPARYRYNQDHRPAPKHTFDIGHAAHRLVLGAGPDLAVIEADSWRTKAAKEQAAEAREDGAVPLLRADYDQVHAMAAAIRAHPIAARLFDPDHGTPEQALIWQDQPTGTMRRALFDWWPHTTRTGGRVIFADYKTCHSADLDTLAKAVHTHGYHQQGTWYLDGAQALGHAGPDAAFVFVCQEKAPPYLVTIVELDHVAVRIGQIRNRRALTIYARCVETGHWPAYHDGVALLSLPPWAEIQEGEHLT